jgi:hypothetical protein
VLDLVVHSPAGASPLRPDRTFAPTGPGLSGSGPYNALGLSRLVTIQRSPTHPSDPIHPSAWIVDYATIAL